MSKTRIATEVHDLRLPLELWLQIFIHSPKSSLRAAALACHALRCLAQPLLFKLFVARLDESSTESIKPDFHPHTTGTRFDVLQNAYVASAIKELRIVPGDVPSTLPHDRNAIVDAIFNVVPTLTNLTTLVCHDITFTRAHLLVIRTIPHLHEVELQYCRTICQPQDFPDFSTVPLRTLIFDYPHSSVNPATNAPLLALFLQCRNLARISAGHTEDILVALTQTPPTDRLVTLEVPASCIGSSMLVAALAACSGVQDILFYMPIGLNQLPLLEHPSNIGVLPNLRSYRGPMIYAHNFTHGRHVTNIEFALPIQGPSELCPVLESLDSNMESFSCNLSSLDAQVFQTIHSSFPSLKKLTISGVRIDIDTIAAILMGYDSRSRIQRNKLEHIQLYISTGEPRLTDSWRSAVSKMFLSYLLRAYPSLRTAKLVYEPQTAVAWARPSNVMSKGVVTVETADMWVEKRESELYRTNAIWDIVKEKLAYARVTSTFED